MYWIKGFHRTTSKNNLNMKYVFIEIDLRIGEDETISKAVLSIEDDQDTETFAKDYLRDFWGEGKEEEGSDWVTYPNDNIGRIRRVEEVTEAEFNILKRFI